MSKAAVFLIFGALFFAACVAPRNHHLATYWKVGDRYIVEVSGARLAMVHDLGALVKVPAVEEKWQFDLPRIDGEIDGREIHQRPGFYPYVGKISIRDGKATIKLSADNYDFKRLDDVSWNGVYTLVEKEANQSPQPPQASGPRG